jgi:hypothetical protein
MSESAPATAKLCLPPFIIMTIIASHTCTIEALTATSGDLLNHARLCISYKNTINLGCAVHSSENLTDQFAALLTETEDLVLEPNAAITDCNALTTWVVQLEAHLT